MKTTFTITSNNPSGPFAKAIAAELVVTDLITISDFKKLKKKIKHLKKAFAREIVQGSKDVKPAPIEVVIKT